MSKNYILVIVESPGKVKKIQKILGNKYKVTASVGHILDFSKGKLSESVDIENNFEPIYKPIPRQRKVIQQLRKLSKNAKQVLLAGDQDREGQFINWSIAKLLKLKEAQQIVYNAITKSALLAAVKNPVDIDYKMVDAQKTRRILDRIVGWELSPLLWKHIMAKLSAGRVQSVVVRLIIDKEKEIRDFMSNNLNSYFKFTGAFISKKKPFVANLYQLKSIKNGIYKGGLARIESEVKARKFLKKCIKSKFKVENVYDKKTYRSPSAPFTTSTIQQSAHRTFGYSVKRTMMAAQKLYEAGHITYMRTDSVNLSKEALADIKDYVIKTFGRKYYKQQIYTSKGKHIQEAHEAIRPTHINITTAGKTEDEIRLYSLIWKRSVASQMERAIFKITSIQISISKESNYYFMTSIENLMFSGFLKVYNIIDQETDSNEKNINKDIIIPESGTTLIVDDITGIQSYTKPPYRYTESSLVNKMDPKNLNIGRPSTYASIIDKIQDRGYVKKDDIAGVERDSLKLYWDGESKKIKEELNKITVGNENNKFISTDIGRIVTDFLIKGFPTIMDYKFTAEMEEKLDDIANGKLVWNDVLDKFYKKFHPNVIKIKKQPKMISEKYTKTLGTDPKTGAKIIATIGKYGPIVKMCLTKTKCNIGPIKEPYTLDTITLEEALKILEYPKELGKYKKKKVVLKTGKYGFYVTYDNRNYPIKKTNNIVIKDAIEVIKEKVKKSIKEFKSDKKLYQILDGPYGIYIRVSPIKGKGKAINVKLPKDTKIDDLTIKKLEEIVDNYYKYKKKSKWKKNKSKNKKN
uniref:DNA topoisomerase n=1 Tax=Mimivirus LCMiAC02 TaxID=2506609 RepID=A0A481Z0Y3_9VIRU|nr:MAG: DNA topoisomerase I [Mimivirus LCMiAC02]